MSGRPVAPRAHAVLACLIAGFLLGPRAGGPVLVAAAAVAAVVVTFADSGDPSGALTALLVAAALLCGAATARARVGALERTHLTADVGHVVHGDVTVLQAPRPQRHGGWSAPVAFRGEPVLLRVRPSQPDTTADTRLPAVGAILRVRAAVGEPDVYVRRLRAHAVLRSFALQDTGRRRGGALGVVDRLRDRALRALARGPEPTRSALLQGMVLGQDAGLPPPTRDEVRAAGLSHLTAASGQNIVLLTTMVIALSALIGVPFHLRWAIVLGVVTVYVPLAGGGPSIQRAGIMGAAGVVAVLAGRPVARWYALGLAALATLLLDPRAATDPGWQLSFAAVLGLLLLARPWSERLHRRGFPGPAAEALAVTGAATLATAPIIAVHFGTVAPASVPANLLVAPVVAPIMWLGVVAALAAPLAPGVPAVLDALADPLLRWILRVAGVAARGPGTGSPTPVLAVLALSGSVLAALGVARAPTLRLPGGRRRIAVAIPALGAGALVVAVTAAAGPRPVPAPPPPQALRVTFLDVGQGDATLLQVPGHAVLVDTGPPDGAILTRLHEAGVSRLDLLVVTHAQADHDGGAAAVLGTLPVGLLLDGRDGVTSALGSALAATAGRRGVRRLPGRSGTVLRAGPLTVTVLNPGPGPTSGATGADPNDRAIVLQASVPRPGGGDDARVLLPADAESDVLGRLDALGPVDVLKVAHHGSDDPGLPALLQRLTPVLAGIEVGARNPFGHPAATTLRALRTVPRTVRTDRDGSVRVDLGPGGWTVRRASTP